MLDAQAAALRTTGPAAVRGQGLCDWQPSSAKIMALTEKVRSPRERIFIGVASPAQTV